MSTNPKRPSIEQLLKAAPMLCRASMEFDPSTAKVLAAGQALTPEIRDEILQRIDSNTLGYYELDVPLLAYEQKTGEDNRNYVVFRDGEMRALGGSGKLKPFLRDHEQRDSLARGGTLIESKTEQPHDGHYQIRQTARLTEPWAIAMYLRGNMTTVSIGWIPTGPVLCSACNAEVFTRCYHFPGDKLGEVVGDDGKKRKVRMAEGTEVVRWIFTKAELIETSCVPVPGVPTAAMDQLRATLAVQFPALSSDSFPDEESPVAATPSGKSPPSLAAPTVESQPENPMPTEQTADVTKLHKALSTALALNEEHRAYASTLATDDLVAFCAKNLGDREVEVKAALEADPIAFTGTVTKLVVRQSHGPLAKQLAEQNEMLAKQNGDNSAALATQTAAAEAVAVADICKSKLAHLPGSLEAHTLIVSALRKSGAPQEKIDAALAALAGASACVQKAVKAPGSTIEDAPEDSKRPQLKAAVEAYAKAKGLTYEIAFVQSITADPTIRALYNDVRAESN